MTKRVDIDWVAVFKRLQTLTARQDQLERAVPKANKAAEDARNHALELVAEQRRIALEIGTMYRTELQFQGRTVHIVSGRAVATAGLRDSGWDIVKIDVDLAGRDGVIRDSHSVMRSWRRHGLGLIIQIGEVYYVVRPTECELQIRDHESLWPPNAAP